MIKNLIFVLSDTTMALIKIDPDYINHQFHIWKDDQYIELGLPVDIQEAIMKKVIQDCSTVFKQALSLQLSEFPPGLESMIPH